ncbi:RNA-binding domain-containing protein [Pleomassaria siparia CBS 279.74]|uniref:RNA-binding domain-containing protein n=1 Tax=Pleomassaria siparia CBS 279.74 TaxID=1314801 RepID=A0A6G1K8D9_9PLEO|nr:RNA-binding domain-containing protein [Pleomassaria siparia CBS 279.74]
MSAEKKLTPSLYQRNWDILINTMAPHRKRQRLSEDGTAAVTASASSELPTRKDTEARKQLFVRSLAASVTTEDLTAHFSESYPIKHAVVVLDPATKESKRFGFVTFADAEDAQRAKEELDGSKLAGSKIRVEVAESRQRDVDTDAAGRKKGVSTGASASAKHKAEREQQKKDNLAPKLIVRNLPWTVKEPKQLEKFFLSYGKVHFVNLPKTPTGELKGFGFVAMRGKKNAQKALEGVDGKEVDGRTLAVDWAVDRDTWQNLQKAEKAAETTAKKEGTDIDAAEFGDVPPAPASDENDSGSEDDDEDEDDFEDVSDSEDGGIHLEEDNGDDDDEEDGEEEDAQPKPEEYTLFVRNLPFTVDNDMLYNHFTQFGRIGFARIVVDRETERPKGTGFVRFVNEEDAINCLKGVPKVKLKQTTHDKKDGTTMMVTHSVLENENEDPTGAYTIEGRILHISRAVDRNEAVRLTTEGAASRFSRDKDKRRLYLLSEGTIPQGSPLYQTLSPSEITMREASAKQRQKLIQANPSLHLSLTRLSVRNIPRSITSKDLKALARGAVVGFAEDVKAGKRERLSKEELARGGADMEIAEKVRKKKGKGLVKQAKIVFETEQGSKVAEETGAGRSRGYGFIEYYTHRNALMGLRKLNGHAVDYKVRGELPKGKNAAREAMEDRKKRLIVEFAIENANVVNRRGDREAKSREHSGKASANAGGGSNTKKRKRGDDADTKDAHSSGKANAKGGQGTGAEAGSGAKTGVRDDKLAQRDRIIRKKRMARRVRKSGKA